MKTALFQGRLIEATEGVEIKDGQEARPDFLCAECGTPAQAFRANGHMPDRFEHLERNDHCSLVHRPQRLREVALATAPEMFEPTSSWCYRFARYSALPEILSMPEVIGGQPFRLVELSQRVLDEHLTPEQQAMTYPRPKAGGVMAVRASVKFYIPFIGSETGQLTNLGGGMFRLPNAGDIDEEAIEADAVDAGVADGVEDGADLAGWVYAFTFPMIRKTVGEFPIKVGKTSGDVDTRVATQCKQSASFDHPIILGRWKVNRVSPMELAIHNVLKTRGKWRENAPGTEWFDTTLEEIEEIVKFVTRGQALA